MDIDSDQMNRKQLGVSEYFDLKEENKITSAENIEKTREKLKNRYGVRKYRIQEVIKPNQVILVQVLIHKLIDFQDYS